MAKRTKGNQNSSLHPKNLKIASPTQASWDREDWTLVIAIVLLAATLRLLNLSSMEFKSDEAANLFLASELAAARDFPLSGIGSSIGTANPPLFTYLMALPLLFSRNPVVAAGVVTLFNCAAVGLLYVFARRYFDRTVAIVAAGFFALNPWAILYSRKVWQQDLLPFFVMVFFYCLFAVVCEGRTKLLSVGIACLAAMTQLHLTSIYYLIVLGIVLLWYRPKARWIDYATGLGIALVLYAPYIVYDILNQGDNFKLFLRAANLPSRFHPEVFTTPLTLGSTLGFMHFVDWPWLDWLQMALIAGGVLLLFFRWRDSRYVIVTLWFCLPVFFLSWSKLELPTHYFIFLYPVQFLVLGILAAAIVRAGSMDRVIFRHGLVGLLLVLSAYQLQSAAKFLTAIENGEIENWAEYGREYGPPFKTRVREIRELIRQGIVEPEQVQENLLARTAPDATFKYDYRATEYIVRNIDEIPY